MNHLGLFHTKRCTVCISTDAEITFMTWWWHLHSFIREALQRQQLLRGNFRETALKSAHWNLREEEGELLLLVKNHNHRGKLSRDTILPKQHICPEMSVFFLFFFSKQERQSTPWVCQEDEFCLPKDVHEGSDLLKLTHSIRKTYQRRQPERTSVWWGMGR